MESEKTGQNNILIVIIVFILWLSFYAIPSDHQDELTHKLSQKALTMGGVSDPDGHEDTSSAQASSKDAVADSKQSEKKPPAITPIKVAGAEKYPMIALNNPAYPEHKKGIVEFTHQKHVETYAITCGECHHDESGTPLELTFDDSVQSCIECHKETEKPKGEKLDKKDKIAKYHKEALHANCIDCHKKYNIEQGDPKGKKPAPTSCTNCHPKQ